MCFPEFDGEQKEEKDLLAELVRLTKYERKFLDMAFDELKRVCVVSLERTVKRHIVDWMVSYK